MNVTREAEESRAARLLKVAELDWKVALTIFGNTAHFMISACTHGYS